MYTGIVLSRRPFPPRSTLFPYTTLFRSGNLNALGERGIEPDNQSVDGPRSRIGCRSEEHTSELQSRGHLVCRLLLEKKKHLSHVPPACSRDTSELASSVVNTPPTPWHSS